jgi:hypothetical protein
MKNLKSIVKITILVNICLLLFTSSMAQKLLSQLNADETAKGINLWYMAKKDGKLIVVENTQNKFANVKQNSPNLPINLRPSKFDIFFDKTQLTNLCAKYITLQQLETMNLIEGSGLLINIRTDIYGKILEVFFSTEQTSMLSLTQIEQIENNIKASSNLVSTTPEIQKYLQGSNFWLISKKFFYDDILKAKKETTPSLRTKDPRRL